MGTLTSTETDRLAAYTVGASSSTGPFPITFPFADNDDIAVYINGTKISTYAVTQGSAYGTAGNFVTLETGVTNSTVSVVSEASAVRSTTDSLTLTALNGEIDNIYANLQENQFDKTRSMNAPLTDATTVDMTLPSSTARAGKVLAFNSTTGNPEAGPDIAGVSTVTQISADIGTVAGISANVTAVAGISSDVTNAANITADISSVAGITSNVTTVAGMSSNITTVAAIASDISTVAADAYDIGRVSLYSTEVNAVGDNIAAVDTVADNIGSVNYFFNRYKTGTTDPSYNAIAGTPAEGDLFYNTAQNKLKVYTGFSGNGGQGWLNGSAAGDGLLSTSGGTMTGFLGGLQESLHLPQSVTGTTPALNVGNNNFFDNGTLTATTSPTFTNVPTKARWQYSFNSGSGGVGYHIPDTTEVGQDRAFQPIANVARPTSLGNGFIYQIRFSADGDKIFFLNGTTDRIHQYALTANWDITTIAATETTNYYYGSYESNAFDFSFSPDGMHMYVTGTTADSLRHWTLTGAFDLTTLVYNDFKSLVSNPYSHHITADGMHLFVMSSSEYVYKFNFTTAWDASSIGGYVLADSGPTVTGSTFADSAAALGGFTITPDGLTLIACGNQYEKITHTSLITPHVMSDAANLTRHEISTAALNDDISNYAFGFSPNGKYMWLSGHNLKTITLFDTSSPCQVTLPSSVAEGSPTLIKPNARTTMEFVTSNGGTNVNLIKVDVV